MIALVRYTETKRKLYFCGEDESSMLLWTFDIKDAKFFDTTKEANIKRKKIFSKTDFLNLVKLEQIKNE